jgi:Putative prokaryotic signal transducing protein
MSTTDRDDHSEPVAVASFATYGEAEIAQAKLRGYGIDAALDDQIEGGTVVVEGEPGVNVEVRAADAEDARRILSEDDDADADNSQVEI